MKDGGGYAFPNEHPYPEGGPGATRWHTGMTLRQWYKGMAIAGYNANPNYERSHNKKIIWAGEDADALIAEDKKGWEIPEPRPASERSETEKKDPEPQTTADCSGCGNFFEPESPGITKCKECLQEEAEEAHDAGECIKDCPICAEEKRS